MCIYSDILTFYVTQPNCYINETPNADSISGVAICCVGCAMISSVSISIYTRWRLPIKHLAALCGMRWLWNAGGGTTSDALPPCRMPNQFAVLPRVPEVVAPYAAWNGECSLSASPVSLFRLCIERAENCSPESIQTQSTLALELCVLFGRKLGLGALLTWRSNLEEGLHKPL